MPVYEGALHSSGEPAERGEGEWKPEKKKRTCLRCQRLFPSAHSGNRFCDRCTAFHGKHGAGYSASHW